MKMSRMRRFQFNELEGGKVHSAPLAVGGLPGGPREGGPEAARTPRPC